MGPRLSTGGNSLQAQGGGIVALKLQWGPVSRRGGTFEETEARLPSEPASMGPRLSTGGNVKKFSGWSTLPDASMGPRLSTGGNLEMIGIHTTTLTTLQWGPVSRRGGT